MKRRSASLGVMFGIVAVDLLGFGIVIPQLGVYGVKFHASPFMVGLLLSVYSFTQFFCAPVLGWLSDRHGRRPVLLYSVAGSVTGYVLFAFASSLPTLFLARIIDGLSGANIATAQAYVADVTTRENRAKGMGLIGAAFGIGFLLGPGIGGFLGAWGGNLAIGLTAASLASVNWVLAFLLVPESLDKAHAVHRRMPTWPWTAMPDRFRLPVVGNVLTLFFVFITAFALMEGTFSVFVLTQHVAKEALPVTHSLFTVTSSAAEPLYREASFKVGYLFAVIGLIAALIQGGLIGRLQARFGEVRLATFGLVFSALGIGLLPAAPTFAWFFAPVACMAIGSALVNPSLSALVSLHSPKERQGELLGAYQSMASLGRILGPMLGGLLFTVFQPAMPYWVAGIVLVSCAVFSTRLWTVARART